MTEFERSIIRALSEIPLDVFGSPRNKPDYEAICLVVTSVFHGRRGRYSDVEIAQIKRLWLSGEHFNAGIAKQFQCSASAVGNMAARGGWRRSEESVTRYQTLLSQKKSQNARDRNAKHGNPSPFKIGIAYSKAGGRRLARVSGSFLDPSFDEA